MAPAPAETATTPGEGRAPARGGAEADATSVRSARDCHGFSGGRSSRPVLAMLRHPLFSTGTWSIFLLMSLIMLVHNFMFQSWGIGTFASITARVERHGEQGVYSSTPLYDAEGKPSFLAYARTPAGRFMHMLPAGLWSIIAPLQLSPTFRARYRTAHRRLGRLFIFMSVSMSLGLVPMVLAGATVGPKSVFVDTATIALAVYFLGTGLLAVCHARSRRFADHRVWMLRHVAMGYSVHMQRLLGHTTWWVFPHIVPGYTNLTPEGERKRAVVFVSYFFAGAVITVASTEVWLRHTSPSGKLLDGDKKNIGKVA